MQKLLPILLAFLTLPLLAEDWVKKDPDVQARENLKSAKSMKDEAKFMASAALKLEGKDAKVVKDYAEATADEADWLEKSAIAYAKNQLRLAERAERKAAEYCEKRGKMLGEIDKLRPKLETKCDPDEKKSKCDSDETKTKEDRLKELNQKQAELEAEKKKLIEQGSH